LNFPLYIAKRYLFSKKSQNVINIISAISVTGVAVGTMALIVVLSAFNGLENLVISLFNSFDPDIKITLNEGKTFNAETFPKEAISKLEGVAHYNEVLQESALVEYRDQQYIATIKGVGPTFVKMSGLDTMMSSGKLIFEEEGRSFAVVGQGVAYSLNLSVNDLFSPLTIYMPKRGKTSLLNPESAFVTKKITTSGVFSIQKDFDIEYILVPISFTRSLLQYDNEVSAIEIDLHENVDVSEVQKELQALVGAKYKVEDRFQQHEFLYKIMKSEKWGVFLILTFILILATFNSIASITMIVFDKKKDIRILWGMGAETSLIKRIFLMEGMFITLLGNVIGITLGALICHIQQTYEVIRFEGNFVAEAIPVTMEPMDFIYVFITVTTIGLIAGWIPVRKISPEGLV